MSVEEGPAYGGAILAMVGAKEYETVGDAVNTFVTTKDVVMPCDALTEKYELRYSYFKKLYPALKGIF